MGFLKSATLGAFAKKFAKDSLGNRRVKQTGPPAKAPINPMARVTRAFTGGAVGGLKGVMAAKAKQLAAAKKAAMTTKKATRRGTQITTAQRNARLNRVYNKKPKV